MSSRAAHSQAGIPVEELLGPLNEFELPQAPKILYIAGNRALLSRVPRVSIVGSREASEIGLQRSRKLARILAGEGIPVVSGLARGIDTAAHRGAMVAGGQTIAVIGTPLSRTYPKENEKLQQEIAERHLVISQFAEGTATYPGSFPIRNRTMALISQATVIVEAGNSSGSLSQGWESLRLGRRLFIMDSVFKNSALTWPTEMARYGAEVLTEPADLLEALPTSIELSDLSEVAF